MEYGTGAAEGRSFVAGGTGVVKCDSRRLSFLVGSDGIVKNRGEISERDGIPIIQEFRFVMNGTQSNSPSLPSGLSLIEQHFYGAHVFFPLVKMSNKRIATLYGDGLVLAYYKFLLSTLSMIGSNIARRSSF